MKLDEHIHILDLPFQIRDPSGRTLDRSVRVYLIVGQSVCLIDCGVSGSEKVILDYLEEIGRGPGDISHIVLTHSHPDHIGAAAALQEITSAKVAGPEAERSWIEDVREQALARPVPGFSALVGGSIHLDLPLSDGSAVDLGSGLCLRALSTPGHSHGSLSYLLKGQGVIFTGDAIPVPGDVPIYDDPLESIRSLMRLKDAAGLYLASWDRPKRGALAAAAISDGIDYIEQIHQAMLKADTSEPSLLARKVLDSLDLSHALANPMLARTLQSHLPYMDRPRLMDR